VSAAGAPTSLPAAAFGGPTPIGAPAAELRVAVFAAELRWTTRQDVPFEPFMVHLNEVDAAIQATIFLTPTS
jgi:hypothetical protein